MNILDLIEQYTPLKRTASTDGGEWHGACPLCGGKDRFAVWPNSAKPGWWCRQCNRKGDAIQFLRELGHSYPDACRMLGEEPREKAQAQPLPPAACNPPSADWRKAGAAFVLQAQAWLEDAPDARQYLHSRGLTDATIARAGLGYNPAGRTSERAKWGIANDGDKHEIWLPQGIVIPCYAAGTLWKIQIRRDEAAPGHDRYMTVNASGNALYGADSVQPNRPAMLVEGPFDALAASQAAGDLCGVAACGTSGARRARWQVALGLASEVLISLDADDAGDAAARWWVDALPNARRWRPSWSDPAQMLQDGADVRGWVLAGLRKAPRVYPVHPAFVDFWAECEARGWAGHIERHAKLCAAAGADYQATIATLRRAA